MNQSIKERLIGIGVILLYFLSSFLETIWFSILNVDYEVLPMWFRALFSFVWQLVLLLIVIIILYPTLKKNVSDLRKNHKEYFKKYFKYWFLILGIMMVSNLLISLLTPNDIANNEESIRQLFEVAPLYTFVVSVFIAPFLEELIFREGIRKVISNNTIFILVSGLVFGSLHVVLDLTSLWDLFYIIPYSAPGIIFAYILTKTDNVLVPASIHFLHNGVLMSLQVLLLLLS